MYSHSPTNAPAPAAELRSIPVAELHRRWQGGEALEVLDVRSARDFAAAHVPMARSLPFETLDPGRLLANRERRVEEPLFVICQIGRRSAQAAGRLLAAGFSHVVNVEGGTRAWQRAGLPVVGDDRAFPRGRQVQLVAGTLVLAGSILAVAGDPLFLLVPALVGVGSIHAGMTGSCLLGRFLGRLSAWSAFRAWHILRPAPRQRGSRGSAPSPESGP